MSEIKDMAVGKQFEQGEQTCTVVERVESDQVGAVIVFIEFPAVADESGNPVM